MTSLSTHVLDLASGRPAADVAVTLLRRQGPDATAVASRLTDADGRARLLEAGQLVPGGWRLTYDIGAYYARGGGQDPASAFLDVVTVDFVVADDDRSYHVPLLVSPFGYSTYRGS